jgi:hypothetical protein
MPNTATGKYLQSVTDEAGEIFSEKSGREDNQTEMAELMFEPVPLLGSST